MDSQQPRDSNNYDAEAVEADAVRPGDTLVFDWGKGRELFQVEGVKFSSQREDDGSYASSVKLTSGTPWDGGPPRVVELPAGRKVVRLLGRSAR